MIIELDSKVIR